MTTMSPAGLRRRQARIAEGEAQLAGERAFTLGIPSQGLIVLALLRCLEAAGGTATPAQIYDQVAQEVSVAAEARTATVTWAGEARNVFERQVRHAYQFTKGKGLTETPTRGEWTLTGKGADVVDAARPGVVHIIFETDLGRALWGNAEDAIKDIEPGSIATIYTSPMYPVLTRKAYGGLDTASWLPWMLDHVELWKPLLVPGGSLFLNLGGEIYRRGGPWQSTYLERLVIAMEDRVGYRLAQRWHWLNNQRLGSIEWVSKQRRRLRQTIEPVYWFVSVKDGVEDQADNRAVLQPYQPSTVARYIGQSKPNEARRKPSGLDIGAEAFARDNGGAIPSTVITATNGASNDAYRRYCRANGLPMHPATSPAELPERAILMTTRPGDAVLDPMGGSARTGAVAEKHGRRWVVVERLRHYLLGGGGRFPAPRFFPAAYGFPGEPV